MPKQRSTPSRRFGTFVESLELRRLLTTLDVGSGVGSVPSYLVVHDDFYDLEAGRTFRPDPTADPLNYLWLSSEAGDPVGGGQADQILSSRDGWFSPGGVQSRTNPVDDSWYFYFAAPGKTQPTAGAYDDAVGSRTESAYVDVPGHPYLYVRRANAPSYSSMTGSFAVLRATYAPDTGTATSFAVDFIQYTDGSTAALRGSFRYNVIYDSLLANDAVDAAGHSLTAQLASAPAHGTLALTPDGFFVYVPDPGFVGVDSFTYTVTDGTDVSEPATATLRVTPHIRPAEMPGYAYNVYPGPNGTPIKMPLAGRTVFDDLNANGSLDPGEPTAVTDMTGGYRFGLGAGVHTIRLLPKPGWHAPAGMSDVVTVDVSLFNPPGVIGDLCTAMDDPVVIDVLAFVANRSSDSDPEVAFFWSTQASELFARANAVFANSDTNVRLNLVGVHAASYGQSGDLRVDLRRLSDTSDGYLDSVPGTRLQARADLAVLFVAGVGVDDLVGLAYELDPAHPDPSRGYLVVSSYGGTEQAGYTLAHEIGHTLGADHDAAHSAADGVPYAHGIRIDLATTPHSVGDIMAYDVDTTLPFFSNPDIVLWTGQPLGNAGSADNARVIRENAATVAAYDGSSDAPPVTVPSPDPAEPTDPTGPTDAPSADPPAPVPGRPVPRAFAVTAALVTVGSVRIKPGTNVAVSATVRNTSAAKFSGKVVIAFYLSSDRRVDSSDALLKRSAVSAKNVKTKATFSTSKLALLVGPKVAAGTYYVLAVATPTGTPADERAAKAASAALKVAAPPKKTATRAKVAAAGFQTARPIVEQGTGPERSTDDADDVIAGLLLSSR